MVAVDLKPWRCASRCTSSHGLRPALLGLDALAHALRQHLRAAAGQRVLTRLAQAPQHVGHREPAHLGHGLDLGRGEEVRGDLGEAPPRLAHDVEVVVQGQSRIVAALEEHRRRALLRRERDLLQHLLHRQRPRLRIAGLAVERAELAVRDADVGVVRIAVDHEGHAALGNALKARLLRERADLRRGAPR
jgi:hypothetical protein